MTNLRITSFLLVFFLTTIAFADYVVTSSTATGIVPGQIIGSGFSLNINEGDSVTLVSQSGKTVVLKGPRSGPFSSEKGGGNGKLLASLSNLLAGRKESSAIGAMRSLNKPSNPDDPWMIDISRSGDQCAQSQGAAILWRPNNKKAIGLSLKNMKTMKKANILWSAEASTLSWPEKMTFSDGGVYIARLKGMVSAVRLILHKVPANLSTDAHRAAWMADKGCSKQAKLLLSKLH